METVAIVLLVFACIAIGIARYGVPFRGRRRVFTADAQRAFAESLLPKAEEELRERGVSEEEIAERTAKLRTAEAQFRDVEDEREF